jgi:molybdenum cofactor guanylyltransferase
MAGVDKGLLAFGRERLCDGPLRALHSITDDVAIAGGRPERSALLTAAFPTYQLLWDEPPDIGPIGGILAALAYAGDRAVVVVAWDMPFVTPDVLRVLVAAMRPGVPCAMPELQPGAREPLCAAYSSAALPATNAMLTGGRAAPRDILESAGGASLGIDAFAHIPEVTRMFTSVDSPEALDAARRVLRP